MEMSMNMEYSKDFNLWAEHQASFLRSKNFAKIDIKHLAKEIESLVANEKSAIRSQLVVLFTHLLKKQYQSEKLSKSWLSSIFNSTLKIESYILDSPSLKKHTMDCFDYSYRKARLKAAMETGLDEKTFPKKCPWTFEDLFEDE